MKRKIFSLLCTLCAFVSLTAISEASVLEKSDFKKVENIGIKLLTSNNIDKKITFTISGTASDGWGFPILKDGSLVNDFDLHNNRNAYIYAIDYVKASSDDEIAAMLAHNVAQAVHSYKGVLNGQLMFTKDGAFPFNYFAKVNELNYDKQAVDYLVNAGYNPVAIITMYSKTLGDVRGTCFSRHNKAEKRMNNVMRYIQAKYPQYLKSNIYTESVYYKRFVK